MQLHQYAFAQPHLVCCLTLQHKAWAARYYTWLLINLTPKCLVSSFSFQDKAQQSERMLAEMAIHIRCSWYSVDLHSASRLAIQDKAQQSERMLAEMAVQMQQLRVEKEELQGRNKLLESLLKVQQQQQHDSSGGRRLDASQVWGHLFLHLSC